ncbi:MAG: hypothetical protein ACOYJ1_16065 [Peptococcales bacterium]|jgi:hypothetical protein
MIEQIDNALESMGQRRILFIIGDHLSGKTRLVKDYLFHRFGQDADSYYVDVGLFIKSKITDEHVDLYRIYPTEFVGDADVFFKQLIKEKYQDKDLIVLDHMEFLLSEKYVGWIKILDKITVKNKTAIIVVPSEYEKSLPLFAYKYLKVD